MFSHISSFFHQNSPDYDWRGYNDLRRALINQDLNLARRLINDGVEVNPKCTENHNDTPLHLAVMLRCCEMTKLLLDKGADTHAKDWNLDTPITLAAKMENRDLVNLLLCPDVRNHENGEYFSHLHVACLMNRVDIVKKLVLGNHGKDINKPVSKHSVFWPLYTPLHFAVHYGCIETVECLLLLGADMMIKNSRKLTPLHLAYSQRSVRIVDLLLSTHKQEFRNPVNRQGLSHFHIACSRDDTSVVAHFLQLEVDIDGSVPMQGYWNKSPWQSFAPIDFAMYHGCLRVINFLLEANAHFGTQVFPIFHDLLNSAFMEKNESIVNLFIPKSLELINVEQKVKKLPGIHWASIQNDVEKMEQLSTATVDSLIDFNASVSMGLTALHLAVKYNSKEAVGFLLDHGADILRQDSNGETPIHIAFKYTFLELLELLLKNFTSQTKNLMDCNGLSLFHILCTTDKIEAIKNLIDTGLNMNARVNTESVYWPGFTALHFACLFNQKEVIKLLLSHNAEITITNGRNLSPFDLILENLDSSKSQEISEAFSYLSITMLHGASRNLNVQGISLLHALCINQTLDSEVMHQYILDHVNEINKATNIPQLRKYNKCTPLHLTILFENYAHANLLLENGADPFVVNDEGKTPLECMVSSKLKLPARSILVENCFTLGASTQDLPRPSHFYVACALSLPNVVSSVLDKVFDEKFKMSLVNCFDDRGSTPLHYLSGGLVPRNTLNEMICLLLTNGADVGARDCQLNTPLHMACYLKGFDVISLLLEHGSDVNAQNIFGQTPFDKLSAFDYVTDENLVILLLDHGADINLLDRQGRTSLLKLKLYLEVLISDRFEDYEGFQDCIITYLKHVKKLQLIGYYIREMNLEAYSESLNVLGDYGFEEAAFINECKKELELMGTVYIDRYTTLRGILPKSYNEMVRYCDNVSLREMTGSNHFYEKYPIYGSIVKLQLKNGRIRRPLLIESKRCLTNMIQKHLPQSCLEAILQYCSNKDLKCVIMSREMS